MEITTANFSAISSCLAFVFGLCFLLTAIYRPHAPSHRCWIPACERIGSRNFSADWVSDAIPFKNGHPEPCRHYQYIGRDAAAGQNGTCEASNFNQSIVVYCTQFIIRNSAGYALSRVDMLCRGEDNKLAFLQTTGLLGRFIALPAIGLVAHKLGRLLAIFGFITCGGLFMYLQTLPVALDFFELYLLLEFLVSLSTTGIQGAGILLDTDWLASSATICTATVAALLDIFCVYAAIGLVSNCFDDDFFANNVMFAAPMWLVPIPKIREKVKGVDEVRISMKSVTRLRSVQELSINRLRSQRSQTTIPMPNADEPKKVTLRDLLGHKVLALRLLTLAAVWLFVFFACFGIVLRSANGASTDLLGYVIVGVVNVPCALFAIYLLNRVGRRFTIASAMMIYGLVMALSTQVSIELGPCNLLSLVVSKTTITTTMIGMGAFTTEFWPSSSRDTVYGICRVIGRLGNVAAAGSSIFVQRYVQAPGFVYAAAAVCGAGLLLLFLPETADCEKLPDTIDEALAIGEKK